MVDDDDDAETWKGAVAMGVLKLVRKWANLREGQ